MILPPITIWPSAKSAAPISSPQIELAETDEMPDTETKVMESAPFEYRNIEVVKGFQISRYNLLIYIWLAGAAVFLLRNIISYLLFLRTIRKNSKLVSCPMLDGIRTEKK
jgi:hypothetical protein